MDVVKISAADVKKLRDATGAGMMDCKKALKEANGDFDKAIEVLRKTGQKMSAKRADRDAKEGVVIAQVSEDKTKGVIIRLSCETDFVAKGESFIALAQSFADAAMANFPDDLEALLGLDYEGGLKISEKVVEQVGVIGEKLELAAYEKIEAPMVAPYIHMGYKAGVLVGLSKAGDFFEAGRGVAMQVAAMKPLAVNKDGIDSSVVEKEIEIGKEIARKEGKPEAMLERIAMGKLNKFFKENTLLNQLYVKSTSKETVEAYLKSLDGDLTVTNFKHVTLG